jgi:cobalt-zinc-cadmium efflux system outer membrane protein
MEGRRLSFIALSACALLTLAGCQTARELALRRSRELPTASKGPAVDERSRDDESAIALTAAELDAASELEAPAPEGVVVPPAAEPTEMPAEQTADGGLTLAQLQSMALANNPSIRQAASAAHKAMGFQNQVGLYPNPTAGYSGNQLFDDGTDQHTAYISQDIVTADKLGLNRCVLSQSVQMQLWDLETQRRRILTDVERVMRPSRTHCRRKCS